ncbi:MAG: class I SAM-dependent RNA methyltransferase [Candidatus Methylacidiphilales bacterium]|nr:TRAM domain-containing protein [Candidatus Methylacidiphilales bacterium]
MPASQSTPATAAAPLSYGSTIRVDIASVAFGGDGVGRLDGRVIFIPFTAVGDTVDAKVTEVHPRHAKAGNVRVVTPSPARETAPCPYYTQCGGCQYQHMSYAEELRLKTQQVRETFTRIAKIKEANVLDILPSPEPYGYRNRITVHAEGGRVGFRSTDGRRLVDIARCLLAAPEVNQSLETLRKRRPQHGHFSLRSSDIPRSAFHQSNRLLLDSFSDQVLALLPQAAASGQSRAKAARYCLELYSGGGFFTERIASLTDTEISVIAGTPVPPHRRFEHIWAIEQDGRLVLDARRKKMPNVSVLEGSVEDMLGNLLFSSDADTLDTRGSDGLTGPPLIPSETLLIADPPREGLSSQVLTDILRQTFAGFIYISCNPATLARDAAKLSDQYTLKVVQPVDMFPRTAQIECISVWEPKTGTL